MNARTLEEATQLWEATGTGVVEAARAVSALLAENGMSALIAGGIAVQLHGYPRLTVDVDIVVRDVQEAHEFLLGHGYSASVLQPLAVIDNDRRVRIDLLPAGRCLKADCEVPFPDPPPTPAVMQPVKIETLISLKLDSWKHTPLRRLKDKADVVELIIRNELPRDLKVHSAVLKDYQELWDGLEAEPPGPVT
jgi:hypothetical protein